MTYEAETNNIRFACTGDSLISRRLSMFREERFLQMVKLLRGADVAFTNAECVFTQYSPAPGVHRGSRGV